MHLQGEGDAVTNLRSVSNLELARVALNALEELERRGNTELESARQTVFYFHTDVLGLKCRMDALLLADEMRGDGEPDDDEYDDPTYIQPPPGL